MNADTTIDGTALCWSCAKIYSANKAQSQASYNAAFKAISEQLDTQT